MGMMGMSDVARLVHGIGINNADYSVRRYERIGGSQNLLWGCPFYDRWYGMIERCYSAKRHLSDPTYMDCYVCDDWLIFSNFKSWMECQDWEGKQIDKDHLIKGNRVYSPDTCIFVTSLVNSFIVDCHSSRGEYMVGVNWDKHAKKFRSQISNPFTRKREHLGLFVNELDAHLKWKARKHELACQLADSNHVTDTRLEAVLRARYLT